MGNNRARMTAHHGKKLVLLVIALLVLLAGVFLIVKLTDQEEPEEPKQIATSSFMLDRRVYNGKTYVERTGITPILLIGVDRTDLSPVQTGYRSGGQADFLLLIVIDSSERKVSMLHIDRDTITDVVTLGILGKRVGTRKTQICLAHAYGANQLENGQNTIQAVANLLEGIDLSQFYSMNMGAMPVLNDLLGGVTVTMQEDYPDLDPSYVKGAVVTLNGQQAYDFVHARYYVGDQTNRSRMIRQRTYMQSAQEILLKKLSSNDSEFVNRMYDQLGDNLTTNIARGQLINEGFKASKYTIQPVEVMEGEYSVGSDGHIEFHANQDWIVNWVLRTFFREDK